MRAQVTKMFNVGVVSTLACLVFVISCVSSHHGQSDNEPLSDNLPKDERLIAIFNAHRNAFEKIQQMAAEDAQLRLYLNAPHFEGFNKSRQQEYEKLISEIYPVLYVSIDPREKGMSFTFAGGGAFAFGSGWEKGINYEPPSSEAYGIVYKNRYIGVALTNLDNASTLEAGTTYIRPIETNWFLYYHRDD